MTWTHRWVFLVMVYKTNLNHWNPAEFLTKPTDETDIYGVVAGNWGPLGRDVAALATVKKRQAKSVWLSGHI